MNLLVHESSPYLKQHAHNPVHWHPWGETAFRKAAAEDKPIFLSIGYSTCHWCHVMAHESFEDLKVAELLNKHFVSIKVDREERPDIDSTYMTVCQMMTGHGGWPLTVFLTPAKEPFFCGTYFPKESRYGRVGFTDLLMRIHDVWTTQRPEIAKSVNEILRALNSENSQTKTPIFKNLTDTQKQYSEIVQNAQNNLLQMFDPIYGGFGHTPKFPSPHKILFLLCTSAGDIAVTKTLFSMFRGGFYDHVAGGFHRYSTDEKWILPHFEKMLYDQAFLVLAYARSFEKFRKPLFKMIAEKTIQFVIQDMLSADGLFYSAFDADSEGEEGKFYVWEEIELKKSLNDEEYILFTKYFDIRAQGNFHDEATRELTGKNIVHVKFDINIEIDDFAVEYQKIHSILDKLAKIRGTRVRPGLDNKVLMDWNGFMITALLEAGRIFKNESYIKLANVALKKIKSLFPDGKIHHARNVPGFLDDYASLIWAFQLAGDDEYAEILIEKTDVFWDKRNLGYFMTSPDHESILTQKKETYDGAYPSGNSIMAQNLIRYYKSKLKPETFYRIEELVKPMEDSLSRLPSAHSHWMEALVSFDELLRCTDESCPLPPRSRESSTNS